MLFTMTSCLDNWHVRRLAAHLILTLGIVLADSQVHSDDEALRFFENQVRPLLLEQCSECHGEKQQNGGLRVDRHASLLKGGDTGPAIVPGDVNASLLLQAVRREDGLEMPPDDPLSDAQIAVLETWIKQGAEWPDEEPVEETSIADRARDHWAFQPINDPDIPNVQNSNWVNTPVDAFVLAKLEEAGLSPSPEADRRSLIRRVSYTLTGLPPSPAEVEQFVSNADPLAYEHLIDRLLDSPHYGEKWARHWLDVARYADTKGYVYAREERFWVHAWAYRDWVVRALNEDMPYNQFLLLQIAADQVSDRRETDLAAMGYLTLGRRFLGVQRDIIDDRIDVVTRGTMALTAGCARCHDHKYDPIPTSDYYSLYGVFDSSREERVDVGPPPDDEAFLIELQKRQETLASALAEKRAASSARARSRIMDYLTAQTQLDTFPAQGFDQVFQEGDLLPAFVRRWEQYLRHAKRTNDPVFIPWHAYAELRDDDFAALTDGVTEQLQHAETDVINPLVKEKFQSSPASFAEVIERYASLFTDIDVRWQKLLSDAGEGQSPTEFDDRAAEQLRRVLYGPGAPSAVPDEPIVQVEAFFPSAVCTELWKLQGEVDRWLINSPHEATQAVTLVDREQPIEPRVFLRGDPLKPGDDVPRHFLSALSSDNPRPFEQGSGRLELAQAIVDPTNPLTARVIVNRVWTHHFGEGLVTTPSDFGTRADEPSHPELLDWLTSRFIADGWSLKSLHRLILLSSTYRQASRDPADPHLLVHARKADPTNRLLWRMNEHRLSFEEFRDSVLTSSGRLDARVGGKPTKLFQAPYPVRRTLYGLVDRQFLPSTLRMFDFANPDLHTPQRPETTVPQQALFLMNHPLIHEQAQALSELIGDAASPEERVRQLFQRTLQRSPTDIEVHESLVLVDAAADVDQPVQRSTVDDWQYGYGSVNEETKRADGFTPLPHFTGNAWQGGPSYPDGQLGWVQLTATGGHPGNDRAHASVRRWTAPRDMTVSVQSALTHEPAAGDGVRAFILSSEAGQLAHEVVHLRTVDLNVESLEVKAGETIDFVVDIRDVLNSDQYLWTAKISAAATETTWNSELDFPSTAVHQLTGWEQLAHVLLCANEFLFVD